MNEISQILEMPALTIGATSFSVGEVTIAGFLLLVLVFLAMVISLWRNGRARAVAAAEAAERARETEDRMADILKAQSEMQGRMASLSDVFSTRHGELNKVLSDRLDGMTNRIGQSMHDTAKSTHENLARLQERLAVIDTAQNNIQALAGQVVELQAILANKQTRGAFGQNRMEAIVADGLPSNAFTFQATLSNGSRPDCVITMPNGAPALVVDAKFPLEAWNAIRSAENPERAKQAGQAFRRDIEVHIKAISEKYLIQGETQDTAFMFVPSESIFAEIHENFEQLIQKAHRARVIIVSPSLLMLSIQVLQAILKDARMREQAHLIQGEVIRLIEDVGRLDDRVRKLQTHFSQASKDIDLIVTSADKLTKRGRKIEDLEFADPGPPQSPEKLPDAATEMKGPAAKNSPPNAGQLRLRVVDGDD